MLNNVSYNDNMRNYKNLFKTVTCLHCLFRTPRYYDNENNIIIFNFIKYLNKMYSKVIGTVAKTK